jgi:hypothetical protein
MIKNGCLKSRASVPLSSYARVLKPFKFSSTLHAHGGHIMCIPSPLFTFKTCRSLSILIINAD